MIGGRPSRATVARNLAYTQSWLVSLAPSPAQAPTAKPQRSFLLEEPAPLPDLPHGDMPATHIITFIGWDGDRAVLSILRRNWSRAIKRRFRLNSPSLIRLLSFVSAVTGETDGYALLESLRFGRRFWRADDRCVFLDGADPQRLDYSRVGVRTGNRVVYHRVQHGSDQARQFERLAKGVN